ncbi:MAG: hypothetical protein AAF487_13915 [Bacteroidota bacterium]
MIEKELIRIWKSSPREEMVKFEKSRLMIEVANSSKHFNQLLWRRDMREIAAALTSIPIFFYIAFDVSFLASKIAACLISIWGASVIFKLIHARRKKPKPWGQDYLKYLHRYKKHLTLQKRILDNVLQWYIVPFVLLMFLFTSGFLTVPGKELFIYLYWVFIILLALVIYRLNKKAAKKFSPKIEQLERLIETLNSPY